MISRSKIETEVTCVVVIVSPDSELVHLLYNRSDRRSVDSTFTICLEMFASLYPQ